MHHKPSLLLIRHAQSENNALGDEKRVPDPNITALGVTQSRKLALAIERAAPTVLYCSPFLRSLETTRPLVERTGITPVVRQDIYEQGGCHRGHLPGARVAEKGMGRKLLESKYAHWKLDERISDAGWYDLDHYETIAEARMRAANVKRWFENERVLHTEQDRVAMVIHADFKMRLLEVFLENPTIEEQLGDIVNTSISRLSYHGGRWRMDYWNVFSHLDTNEISC